MTDYTRSCSTGALFRVDGRDFILRVEYVTEEECKEFTEQMQAVRDELVSGKFEQEWLNYGQFSLRVKDISAIVVPFLGVQG